MLGAPSTVSLRVALLTVTRAVYEDGLLDCLIAQGHVLLQLLDLLLHSQQFHPSLLNAGHQSRTPLAPLFLRRRLSGVLVRRAALLLHFRHGACKFLRAGKQGQILKLRKEAKNNKKK